MSSSSYTRCQYCIPERNDRPPPIPHFPHPLPVKRSQFAQIDAQIRCTDEAISTLVKERVLLSRQRNTLIPAVNLPPEVLVVIFEFACFCISDDKKRLTEKHFALSPSNCTYAISPLLIGSVCSRWRDITLGASQLWTTVKILVNNIHADAQASLLNHWLINSGERPLTVKFIEGIDTDSLSEWNMGIQSTGVIDVVAVQANAQRLETLELFIPISWMPALIRIAPCISRLTRLTLRAGHVTGYLQDTVNFFANAPQLCEVTLVGYTMQDVSLPWVQLEKFTGEDFDSFESLKILRLCQHLRQCTVELQNRGLIPIIPAPMTHFSLVTLELAVDHASVLEAFLGVLTLPALRSLSLSLSYETALTPVLLPFLSRSAHALETLHLVCLKLPEEDIVACLRVLPSLRNLVLRVPARRWAGSVLTQNILDFMNPNKCADKGWETIVPTLESFYYEGPIAFNAHAIVNFLVDRWINLGIPQPMDDRLNVSPARLRSATFKTPRIVFADKDITVLRALRREGMHLEFPEW